MPSNKYIFEVFTLEGYETEVVTIGDRRFYTEEKLAYRDYNTRTGRGDIAGIHKHQISTIVI